MGLFHCCKTENFQEGRSGSWGGVRACFIVEKLNILGDGGDAGVGGEGRGVVSSLKNIRLQKTYDV